MTVIRIDAAMSYGKKQAAEYEDEREHALPAEEGEVWVNTMRALAGTGFLNSRLLDVGAGTGLLTSVMKQAGLRVVGLEPSLAMIQQGLKRNHNLERSDFVPGHADQTGLFDPDSFDWLHSRQALCHLAEPRKAFGFWHRWLKPGGHVLLVDGFWTRSESSSLDPKTHPFAFVDDAFAGVHCPARSFTELNEARNAVWPSSAHRYVVAGRKNWRQPRKE